MTPEDLLIFRHRHVVDLTGPDSPVDRAGIEADGNSQPPYTVKQEAQTESASVSTARTSTTESVPANAFLDSHDPAPEATKLSMIKALFDPPLGTLESQNTFPCLDRFDPRPPHMIVKRSAPPHLIVSKKASSETESTFVLLICSL